MSIRFNLLAPQGHVNLSSSALAKLPASSYAWFYEKDCQRIAYLRQLSEATRCRTRDYVERPILIPFEKDTADTPFRQADFITADLKLTADGRMVVLEFNGISSGLKGYERLHSTKPPSDRNPRRVFYDILAQKGYPLIWIKPQEGWRVDGSNYTQTLMPSDLIGMPEWIEAGGQIRGYEEFVREFAPYQVLGEQMLALFSGNQLVSLEEARLILEGCVKQGLLTQEEAEYFLKSSWKEDSNSSNAAAIAYYHFIKYKECVARQPIFILASSYDGIASASHIIPITRHTQYFTTRKDETARLFEKQAPEFHPRTVVIDRATWRNSLQEIKEKIRSRLIVLKPISLSVGMGIVYISQDRLEETLRILMPESVKNVDPDTPEIEEAAKHLGIPTAFYAHYLAGKFGNCFVLQEYISNRPIRSPWSQVLYDPVMRLVIGLVREDKTAKFYPLDAYWKIPPVPLGAGFQGRISSSVTNGERSFPVSDEDYRLVVDQMAYVLGKVYDRI